MSEGHNKTLSRRALAFAEMNIEVARAILIADEEDAKAEEQAVIEAEKKRQVQEEEEERQQKSIKQMKTVTVDANFDPTKPIGTAAKQQPKQQQQQPPQGAPKPAKKEDVVFQATSTNIQKLVLESPVPVLFDVYADW